jgi:A-macroglobulin TED domain/Alpha-2-macroglobulin family/MG2 domain/Carboxypeptidase regulatory-like domain/A-macroglobulin receptor binding domain/Macroglobulin domain MG3
MGAMRRWCTSATLLFFFIPFVLAQQPPDRLLKIDEHNVRFHLLPQPELELPVVNLSGQRLEGKFLLELVHSDGQVHFTMKGTFQEEPGTTVEKLRWDAKALPTATPSELGWYRLRYTFTPSVNGSDATPVDGVLQMGRLMVDSFEFRMTGAETVGFGAKYPLRVRVDNPTTGEPIAGVPVDFKLVVGDDDDDKPTARKKQLTDRSGYAVVEFNLPNAPSDFQGKVVATATRGDFSEEEPIDIKFPNAVRLALTTDKPLYQPGQSVHMRVLAFGPDHRALANVSVKVTLADDQGQIQFEDTFNTSKFGVAKADWEIPQKLQLGEVSITAEVQSDQYSGQEARSQVRISRYELPTYTVKVHPDRAYYLPGQNASVEVRADYLFGKPVQRAKVKVVRQDNRHWDAQKQQWAADESQALEGELDSDGKFTAHIDLTEHFHDFKESFYQRFEDVTLAAYVTDLSSKRTEQRRFKLRLSGQPIHLYLSTAGTMTADAPFVLYVNSSYADGTPASVDGVVEAARSDSAGQFDEEPGMADRVPLGKFHTNHYGVGRVELQPLPKDLLTTIDNRVYQEWYSRPWTRSWSEYRDYNNSDEQNRQSNALILLRGADAAGNPGHYSEQVAVYSNPSYVTVKTDHALYRPSDPVLIKVLSNAKVKDLIIDIFADSGLVVSEVVHPKHGQAELTVAYDPRFRGPLTVVAYAMTSVGDQNRALSGITNVLYPARQELQVGLRMARTTLRPGETANADLHILTPEGSAVESALGVLVFDKAVAERVRTDEEFGREYGFSIYDYTPNYNLSLGGITYRDLLNLDSSKPFPEGIELLAGELLSSGNFGGRGDLSLAGGASDYGAEAAGRFDSVLKDSTQLLKGALDEVYQTKMSYPKNESELRSELDDCGVDLDRVLDPWGVLYRMVFSASGPYDVLSLFSDGVDKNPNTKDDFLGLSFGWPYFHQTGVAIDNASHAVYESTGKYIRDYAMLREEMKKKKIDLDALRDPWGHPYSYHFEIAGAFFEIRIVSAGPDGKFDTKAKRSWDDVPEWTSSMHYFQQETKDLQSALADHFVQTGKFPQSADELKPVLQAAKLTPDRLLDPWGHPYRFTFSTSSRYWDSVNTQSMSVYGEQPRRTTEVTPVTQQLAYIQALSNGPDNKPDGSFQVAEFSRVIAEQSSKDIKIMPTPKEPPRTGGYGGISGVVTDSSGAVVAQTMVTAEAENGARFTGYTDSSGRYTFSNILTGIYRLEFAASGFRTRVVLRIPVQQSGTTQVDVTLDVGSSSESVVVEAQAQSLQAETASVAQKVIAAPPANKAQPERQLFTPRLRQYFPETLLWLPEVITDKRGYTHIKFPMADNITAWKMSVVASTEAGQVGVAEKELRTFQPLFLEHDPPKILTEGDRIHLPVVIRNYSAKSQSLETELKPEFWFSGLSAPRQSVTVAANSDASTIFSFRADHSVRNGKQRVTAHNAETGDAVEREVVVHPDGQEIFSSVAQVLAGPNNSLEIEVPDDAIPGSIDAELRIYPNLIAHVLDAIHGIGQRPAGCAEQITSVAYVSLMGLKVLAKASRNSNNPSPARAQLAASAKKAVQDAYSQLVDLQQSDGGFPYWSGKLSNLALTAYVLRFLHAASEFVEVDRSVINRGAAFIVARQSKSGAWLSHRWGQEKDAEDLNLTAYMTRTLAPEVGAKRMIKVNDKDQQNIKSQPAVDASFKLGMKYLEDQIDSWKDPYLVGNYALAAAASDESEYVSRTRSLLTSLAHRQGTATYWNLEANTSPFYGWGNTGRLEITALAVEALAKLQEKHPDAETEQQVSRGLQYLLGHPDRYSIWYSTQATQNVIEAMIAAMPPGDEKAGPSGADIVVNGHSVSTMQLRDASAIVGPATLELAQYLYPGHNTVRIVRDGNSSAMNALVITSHYIPWKDSRSTAGENFISGDTRALRLKVEYDHTDPRPDEAVKCHVETERVGFRGYGMMLAEIGLPPGSEVDRESLENARESGSIQGYEVQPDRVVFYVWPEASGSKFDFQFRLRYRMDAMTAPSALYDYYNPEANATIVPVRFVSH